MQLFDVLKIKFPNADFRKDIILQDNSDGKGPYIAQWNVQGTPQPTATDIKTWLADPTIQQQYTFAQNTITNQPILAQLAAIDLLSIRPLRENDTITLTTLQTKAAALRAQLLPTS